MFHSTFYLNGCESPGTSLFHSIHANIVVFRCNVFVKRKYFTAPIMANCICALLLLETCVIASTFAHDVSVIYLGINSTRRYINNEQSCFNSQRTNVRSSHIEEYEINSVIFDHRTSRK